MEKHSLTLNGMGSQHCVAVVKSIIQKHEGASIDDIQIGKVVVSLDVTKISKKELVSAIEKMGYKVQE